MLKQWVKKHNVYCIVTGIIISAMLTMFLITQTFPFGTKNIFAWGDSYSQIANFFEGVFDILAGRRPELFSFYDVGGNPQMLVNILYSCINPFYIIYLICGESLFWYAIGPVIMLQLIVIGITAVIFIRKNFPAVNKFYQVIFSLLYVFSAHFFSILFYVNWIQLALYLPLAVMAFQYMLKTGKILWFATALAAFPISCFALGSYSLIFLFPLFLLYIFMVLPKEQHKSAAAKLCLSYIGAVILAVPVLVPALIGVADSASSARSIFDAFNNTAGNGVKYAYLLLDSVFIMFVVQFFINADYKNKFNKFLIFALILTFLPVFFNPVEKALNMGSYYGFGSRFHFINVFVLFLISLRFVSGEGLAERNKFKNWCVKNKFILLYLSVVFLIGVFSILLVDEMFGGQTIARNASSETIYFSIFIIFTCISLLLINLINKKRSLAVFISIITAFMCQYGLIKNYRYVFGSIEEYIDVVKDVPSNDRILIMESSGVPSVLYGKKNNLAIFSSLLSKNMLVLYNLLSSEKKDRQVFLPATNLFFMSANIVGGDCIMMLGDDFIPPSFNYINDDGKYYLFENTLSLGNAYFLNEINFSSINKGMDDINKQNKMFNAFGGDGDIIKEIYINADTSDLEKNDTISFEFTNEENTAVLLNIKEFFKLSIYELSINDETYKADLSDFSGNNIGYYLPPKGNIKISGRSDALKGKSESESINDIRANGIKAQIIDYGKVVDLMHEIQDRTEKAGLSVNIGVDTAEVTFTKTADTKYLVMPYFNFNGMTATLNGKAAEIADNDLKFIAVDLTDAADGEVVLTLQYKNPYMMIYIITAVTAPILFVLLILFNKFLYDKTKKILEPPAYNGAICLAFVIMFMFFVIPVIYFISVAPTGI